MWYRFWPSKGIYTFECADERTMLEHLKHHAGDRADWYVCKSMRGGHMDVTSHFLAMLK